MLADGLALAVEERPDAIVDIATLTGACMVALGAGMAGVFGNDAAVRRSGDGGRRAPPTSRCGSCRSSKERYRKLLDSDVADLKNVGGPYGGAINAAVFLSEFVGDVPWAHLDIAGPMKVDADESWRSKGATGFGTRLLIDLALNFTALPSARTGAPVRRAATRSAEPAAEQLARLGGAPAARHADGDELRLETPRSSPAASIAAARAWARARSSRWIVVVVHCGVPRLQRRRAGGRGGAATPAAPAGARASRPAALGRGRT